MKLFYSPTSPYVRKALVVAHETGLADRIERLPSAAGPVARDQTIIAHNPLGQVPTMLTDEGVMIADSRVICAYLDEMAGGRLRPQGASERLRAEVDQAMADGILGAALLIRYETVMRPENLRWQDWLNGQWDKIFTTLAYFEANPPGARVDIGSIALACALSYLDLRFADTAGWRARAPGIAEWYKRFAERSSMKATVLAQASY